MNYVFSVFDFDVLGCCVVEEIDVMGKFGSVL